MIVRMNLELLDPTQNSVIGVTSCTKEAVPCYLKVNMKYFS